MSSALQLLINDHLERNIFEELGADYYHCECGSFFKRCNILCHLKTKKHFKYFEENPIEEGEIILQTFECGICYEQQSEFWACGTCTQKVCTGCIGRCERCPFCRTEFPEEMRLQREMNDDDDDETIEGGYYSDLLHDLRDDMIPDINDAITRVLNDQNAIIHALRVDLAMTSQFMYDMNSQYHIHINDLQSQINDLRNR